MSASTQPLMHLRVTGGYLQVECAALDSATPSWHSFEFCGEPTIGGNASMSTLVQAIWWMPIQVVHDAAGAPGNVGTLRVIAPTGNIPYGVPVIPQAKVKNCSTVAQRSRSASNRRDDIQQHQVHRQPAAGRLGYGQLRQLALLTWPAPTPSSARPSSPPTRSRSNDKATGACFVPLVDAGTRAILAPTGTINYGTPVTPQARVKNFGTAVAATSPPSTPSARSTATARP